MRESTFTIAQKLADSRCARELQHPPADVTSLVKLRVLDLLSAHCASITERCHVRLLNVFNEQGETVVWGTPYRRPLRDAIVINSAVSHATYFEDGSRYTGGHPSSAVIPAALSIAASRKLSGSALIAAIAAGYEVFLRLGEALYPAIVNRGLQSTAILAAPATAAASAHLLGLSNTETAHALAIACSQGAGLKDALRSAGTQPIQVGRSSEGGYLASLLAAQGGTGYLRIIEEGFARAFAGQTDIAVPTDFQHWKIADTYLKLHGGCRGNHAAVDAAVSLLENAKLDHTAIEAMHIHVDSVTYAALIEPPRDPEQAKFSVAFSVAARLLKGDVFPARFNEETLHDPRVQDLMQRISVVVDDDLDKDYPRTRPAIARVTLRDGRELTHRVDMANGEPEVPLSPEQLVQKFDAVAHPVLGKTATQVKDWIFRLESLDDVSLLAELLAAR